VLVANGELAYHDDYGINGGEFRVMRKDIKSLDEQKVSFTLRQKTEGLYDTNYLTNPQTGWVNPSYLPEDLYKAAVFELPYNPATGRTVAYLLLAARKNQYEAGFYCYTSPNDSDYQSKGSFKTFSQYGTLSAAYSATTNEIDETGLTYTPYQEDPAFDTVTLLAALRGDRIAIVDSEVMGFRTVTLLENGDVKLTGVIRGMYGTTKAGHSNGADIWLTTLDRNVLLGENASDPYFKFVPYTHAGVFDIASVTAIHKTRENKAAQVPAPRFYAVRSGSAVTVKVQPVLLDGESGAGLNPVTVNDHALLSNARLFYKEGSGGSWVEVSGTEFVVSNASAFDLYVKVSVGAYESSGSWYLAVGSGDGTYTKKGSVPDSSTDLEHVRYAQEAWSRALDSNFNLLNDTLLKVSGMQDVNLSGLADTEVLQWNGSYFVPVAQGSIDFDVTTTTTTSTTSTTTTA